MFESCGPYSTESLQGLEASKTTTTTARVAATQLPMMLRQRKKLPAALFAVCVFAIWALVIAVFWSGAQGRLYWNVWGALGITLGLVAASGGILLLDRNHQPVDLLNFRRSLLAYPAFLGAIVAMSLCTSLLGEVFRYPFLILGHLSPVTALMLVWWRQFKESKEKRA